MFIGEGEKATSTRDVLRSRLTGLVTPVTAVFVILCLCFAASQLRVLLSYTQWWVDEDGAIFWLVGREWAHLSHIDPNSWGQPYGMDFEDVFGELLHVLGLAYRLAMPIADMLIVSLAWAVLAIAAYLQGRRLSAALAIALPTCLSIPSLLLIDQPTGFLSGILLSALTVAVGVSVKRTWLRLGLVIGMAWMSMLWNTSTVIATAPVVATVCWVDREQFVMHWRTSLKTVAAAAAIPLAWMLWVRVFYATHPHEVVYEGFSTQLSVSQLWQNLTHPGILLGTYAPELIRQGWLAASLLVVLAAWALVTAVKSRNPAPAIAAAVFLVVLLVIASTAITATVLPDIYLSGGRFLMPMPFAIWFIAHETLAASPESGRRTTPAVLAAVCVVTLASAISTQTSFRSQINPLIAADLATDAPVKLVRTVPLAQVCAGIDSVYRRYSVQLVSSDVNTIAYGCAAEYGINTIFPAFDRRLWVRNDTAKPIERLLLWGDERCRSVPKRIGVCRHVGRAMTLIITPPRAAAKTLNMLHTPVLTPAVVSIVT